MLDDKIKLEQYFEEEIKRVSDVEIAGIEQEIDEIRKKSMEGLELEAQREAGLTREQELKEMASEHAIRLSKAHEETNRRLMKKRRELTDAVFRAAKQQLKEFAIRKDYVELLKKKASDLAQLGYEQVVFYVADRDQAVLKDICEAYGKPCEGKCDADILLGGFRMECEEKGIVVDETFDTGIDEQKDWFYTNSGLFIK